MFFLWKEVVISVFGLFVCMVSKSTLMCLSTTPGRSLQLRIGQHQSSPTKQFSKNLEQTCRDWPDSRRLATTVDRKIRAILVLRHNRLQTTDFSYQQSGLPHRSPRPWPQLHPSQSRKSEVNKRPERTFFTLSITSLMHETMPEKQGKATDKKKESGGGKFAILRCKTTLPVQPASPVAL